MWCRRRRAVGGRPLESVQRLADGPIADRVDVHLEARGVEPVTCSLQLVRVDEGQPALAVAPQPSR